MLRLSVKFFASAFEIPVESRADMAADVCCGFQLPIYEITQLLNLPVPR